MFYYFKFHEEEHVEKKYNIFSEFNQNGTNSWDANKIKEIPLYDETEVSDEDFANSDYWCVYDPLGYDSCKPVDCKTKDEAYQYLLESELRDIFEFEHDL